MFISKHTYFLLKVDFHCNLPHFINVTNTSEIDIDICINICIDTNIDIDNYADIDIEIDIDIDIDNINTDASAVNSVHGCFLLFYHLPVELAYICGHWRID